jgi:3-phosphoshikimate 1-carboxyvinyltransferase
MALRTLGPGEPALFRAAGRLRGEPGLPGDKSISHRALILAALAAGESLITGASDGGDVRSTAATVAALGAEVERLAPDGERLAPDGGRLAPGGGRLEPGGRTVGYRIVGPGIAGLREPDRILDCGNSGTTLRLMAGVLAGMPGYAVLDGDDSLRRRPVARIIDPLRSMGADLRARRGDTLPPVTVIGHTPLRAVEVVTPVPSAQVKSAILLAALRADGRTTVRETVATRDHTERMLRARGVPVESRPAPDADHPGAVECSVQGGLSVRPVDERVPADVSAAAFWLVAGAAHTDADLRLTRVGVNPSRRAVIDILRAMGADIEESADDQPEDGAEPVADLHVRSSELRAIDLGPERVAAAIDEIPILCLAATQARGTTRIRGAGELRHKESDRLAGIAAGLIALGASVEVDGDDLSIRGPTPLIGAPTDSLGDHRLAMTFAIAGLLARGETSVARAASVSISYPGFFQEIERVGA